MSEPLSKDHRIIEKPWMDYPPFGRNLQGEKIRDVSGVTVKGNVEYLEEVISQAQGSEAGAQAVEDLARLLNERIRDSAYHVTPAFLKNPWHSYSYEFVAFLGEFCQRLTGDPAFSAHCAQRAFIPPLIAALGKPFSLAQIYTMFPYFGEKYAKGSLRFDVVASGDNHATLSMQMTDAVREQFGPYVRASAHLICQSAKAALSMIPCQVHQMATPATITERRCMAEGDDRCEWDITWPLEWPWSVQWLVLGSIAGLLTFGYLFTRHPETGLLEALVVALFPAAAFGVAGVWRTYYHRAKQQEQLVKEQLSHLEKQHEELRETYGEQEQFTVDLKRKIRHLTSLYQTGLLFTSTLDRETLIDTVLESLVRDLHFDRAMISFYDPEHRVAHRGRARGVPDKVAAFVQEMEVPVTTVGSIEYDVLVEGKPVMCPNLTLVWDRLHPSTNNSPRPSMPSAFSRSRSRFGARSPEP